VERHHDAAHRILGPQIFVKEAVEIDPEDVDLEWGVSAFPFNVLVGSKKRGDVEGDAHG
jgi:hypothetical protein